MSWRKWVCREEKTKQTLEMLLEGATDVGFIAEVKEKKIC